MIAAVRAFVAAWTDALADLVAPSDPAVRAAMRTHQNVPAAGVETPDSAGGGYSTRSLSQLMTEPQQVRTTSELLSEAHFQLDSVYDRDARPAVIRALMADLRDRAAEFAAVND